MLNSCRFNLSVRVPGAWAVVVLAALQACSGAEVVQPPVADADTARVAAESTTVASVNAHVEAGQAALASHDLAAAQAAFDKASQLRMADPRVVSGQSQVSEIRAHGAQLVHQARQRWEVLRPLTPTLKDAALWQAHLADLEWLSTWHRDFPDEAALHHDAKEPMAAFLLLQAQELAASGKPQQAEVLAQKAMAWSPGHPDVAALMVSLRAQNDVMVRLSHAEAELAENRAEQALAEFEALAALPHAPADVAPGLREAKKRVVAGLLLRAKDHLGNKNWALAMQLSGRARALQTEDKALAADVDRLFAASHERLLGALRKPMLAAQKAKLPAAALVYASMILAVSPGDKDARKVRAKWAGTVAAAASTTLQIVPAGTAAPVVATRKKRAKVPAESEPVPHMAGLGPALVSGVTRGLAAAGLDHAGIHVVAGGAGKGGKAGKAAKSAAGATLLLDVRGDRLDRTDTPEPRTKNFLDHVEIIDNPAWDDAQARQASTLLALNVALQDLRPVQEGMNAADRELYNLEQQLAAIREKIAEEDKAYYAHNPSPCPDGGIGCEGTRAKVRWRANTDYYDKQLMHQRELLTQLGPKAVQLQGVVDAKQKAYDLAQKTALETPKRVPHEVWLPHTYEVRKVTYTAEASLTAKLLLPAPAAKKKARKPAAAPVPLQTSSTWKQGGEDFATGPVLVKDQVLEPNHPSALPGDVTVVAQVADHLLAPVVPQLATAVGGHGQRFVAAVGQQKTDLEKLQQLALAWLTAPGLPPEVRAQVAAQLAAIAAWQPVPGRLDQGTFVYDRLPQAK